MARELLVIPLAKIRQNPVALRDANRDAQDFQELVDSIKAEGVLSPISVRRVADGERGEDGKDFILVDGLQRFSASQEAGLDGIPAQVLDRTEAESLVTQIVANAHKIETKPTEYAKSIQRILGYHPTMSEAQLAAKLNKSPTWLSKILRLNRLNKAVKPLVDESAICVANAVALSNLPEEEQMDWVERAQTQPSNEFGPAADKRAKEIRDANRKGENAKPEEFVPIMKLRSLKLIEEELTGNTVGPTLIQETEILTACKNKADAALAGFRLGLQWAANFDPKSIEVQQAADTARRQKNAEDKARREAEKKAKKEKEAELATTKAREAHEAAQARVATLTEPVPV